MGDFASLIPTYDGEEHVFAAAQHIVKALAASKNLNDDVRRLLADLDAHLSTMTKLTESKAAGGRGTREVEEQLTVAKKKVMSWQSSQSMIWDSGPEAASEYLQAVYETQRLIESLRNLDLNRSAKQKELLDQAYGVLQMAMERLEEELIHVLAQNKKFFEPGHISFRSCEDDIMCEPSMVSVEYDAVGNTSRIDSSGIEPAEQGVHLVHPDVISDVKSIASVMFASGYDQEFCCTFANFWKEALGEYIVILGADKLSIEVLLKMEKRCLNRKIKKWSRAMKFIVRVYLASEKRLFDQVLAEFGSICSTCFTEASKGSMLCLLNFGEVISIRPHGPEDLFTLLDMYDVLADLVQDVDNLFAEEAGSFVRNEFHEVMKRLGDTSRAVVLKFGISIVLNPSTIPFPGGGIHHLTKYVMNYINLVAEYGSTLNLLLGEQSVPIRTEDISSNSSCPLARYLQSLMSNLETNLDTKSRLYKDGSLTHIFMMNNIHYMVQKVKGSDIEAFFGDAWIREYTGKFQQHATSYERATWSPVLSLLRDDGNRRKEILKERYRGFSIAFEEVYKSQTTWFIPDTELRKDLRISTSQKVIHAYRTFTGQISTVIGDKYIKYTADDLENHILDLFEGSSMSQRNYHKRCLV